MFVPPRIRGYLFATLAVAAATLVGIAVAAHASLADESMLYSLAILVAAHAGRGPGLVAAGLSVVAFDFVFVEPKYTLDVADSRFVFTFAVMFVVGAAIGSLVARLRAAEAASRARERYTGALLAFTRDAAAAAEPADVIAQVKTHLLPVLAVAPTITSGDSVAIDHTTTDPDQLQLVESIGRQATIAIEKLRFAAAARDAQVRATTEELRNALLSAVSHDLRTPLAVILGMASTLRETAPANEHADLDTIVDEADRLARILENLLAVTKVEGGAQPRREWIPVEELVAAALARVEAERDVVVDVPGELLAHVDPVLVELVLVNLLDNAAKHAGTAIELSARRDGAATVIEVADRGPGLPDGADTRVFERFFRAAPDSTPGVGLGLAVCRGIAVAHGGTIAAIRRAGGGTVFRVVFPDAEPMPVLDVS
ncbi:MAG: DUF4118 domain-containing protein [Kofleriaceae bacterium]